MIDRGTEGFRLVGLETAQSEEVRRRVGEMVRW